MNSPRRYRPRYSKAQIDHELRMRKRIRDALADRYPDADRPSGRRWVVALSGGICPKCQHYIFLVQVPGFEFAQICYCPSCEIPLEAVESR